MNGTFAIFTFGGNLIQIIITLFVADLHAKKTYI